MAEAPAPNPEAAPSLALKAPVIELPKGGGALRGIGEKFAVDGVMGTASVTIPIAASQARDGFAPDLSLHYDSGSGNGPFGLGWNLAIPSISRKTDKGLPLYQDAAESDVYILSGAEDLVPLAAGPDVDPDYVIRRYRPRIDAAFARVERWTAKTSGAIHWRTISRDNVATLYGTSELSRVADPANGARVFKWLAEQSCDAKGNAIVYDYVAEDGRSLGSPPVNERNRSDATRSGQRYLKAVRYGNRTPNRAPDDWSVLDATALPDSDWMFAAVFDYGEGHLDPAAPDAYGQVFATASESPQTPWPARQDPFSSYRSAFEIRTYRLCRRVLTFHRFPAELGVDSCLVRSTELTHAEGPLASYLTSATATGFVRKPLPGSEARYLMRTLPPVEFDYSAAPDADALAARPVREVAADSLADFPEGLQGHGVQWLDLQGEGLSGLFAERGAGWYFKANRSTNNFPPGETPATSEAMARFAPFQGVGLKPAASAMGELHLQDLDGDGQLDLVRVGGPAAGYHPRAEDGGWAPFRRFAQSPQVTTRDAEVRLVDLTGDGLADLLRTEADDLRWYRGLGEAGFGAPLTVDVPADEERGPRILFADRANAIHLADMSGDGLRDIVRVRNGGVCYWPNLGYGRFGAKVELANAPRLDDPDRFDPARVRLADTDGSGTSDLVYLHRDGPRLYANWAGNSLAPPARLAQFPGVAAPDSVEVLDLLGTGTACLVWSSPLPGPRVRYVSLMEDKPHLLVAVRNNLGAETQITYAPSTRFYLDDAEAGAPWLTRLPFPVHVVERVTTLDRIAGNVVTSRSAYHHGFFDGVEREFRGFGMVERWDTEAIPEAAAADAAYAVAPSLTRTWRHTGVYFGAEALMQRYAGLPAANPGSFFRAPGPSASDFAAQLLTPPPLPPGLAAEEAREAARALKGVVLREEVYGQDGSAKAPIPYSVTEHSYGVVMDQARGGNRHAVFRVNPAESLTYTYERVADDPRISHSLTLALDAFGNVLQSASAAYGRLTPDPALSAVDQAIQAKSLLTYQLNALTDPVDAAGDYRTPQAASAATFDLSGFAASGPGGRFLASDLVTPDPAHPGSVALQFDSEIAYEAAPTGRQRRLIENSRVYYRTDDLSAVSPLGVSGVLAVVDQTHHLAVTPDLLAAIFQQGGAALNPDPATVLAATGTDGGGYVDLDGDGNLWLPSGRSFFAPDPALGAPAELKLARAHFFRPRCFRTPFADAGFVTDTLVTYDTHDLILAQVVDPLGNTVSAGSRAADGSLQGDGVDYRVLSPAVMSDANRNRHALAFDALGLVVATAVMGKPEETLGDSLAGLDADPPPATTAAQFADPTANPGALLGSATTRLIYDFEAYRASLATPSPQPIAVHTLARDTHVSDLASGVSTVELTFSYSDGFGREIQRKAQAPAGSAPSRDAQGRIVVDAAGQPIPTGTDVDPRWTGSGWQVFNAKDDVIRRFEAFFSDTHRFDADARIGVSSTLAYDPVRRVIGVSHPDASWEKTIVTAWRHEAWDGNDTVAIEDPKTDPDVGFFFTQLYGAAAAPVWTTARAGQDAAVKALAHAGTPSVSHVDPLGRAFLNVAHNRGDYTDTPEPDAFFATRTTLDIEGNARAVTDPLGRTVMLYDYDLLGHRLHHSSMEAGERWSLSDAAGKALRAWDSRGHALGTAYDEGRRPVAIRLTAGAPAQTFTVETLSYGEASPGDPTAANLRGQLTEHRDQAGIAAVPRYDFKGNPLEGSRQFTQIYDKTIDWSAAVLLDPQIYATSTAYDAFNRPIAVTSPDASVTRRGYDIAGHLTTIDVALQGATTVAEPRGTPFVTGIDYDAKGQRQQIKYGNGAVTTYGYDAQTYRLTSLVTARNPLTYPRDSQSTAAWPGTQVQNLSFAYDPVGNTTNVTDAAQQVLYFANQRVEPSTSFLYDATYRIIEATGREHLSAGAPVASSYNDAPRVGIVWDSADRNAMGRYLERYRYDAGGNLSTLQHLGTNPQNPGWTRRYGYAEPSQIDATQRSNRLSATDLGGPADAYGYDAHGNMLTMPQLQAMVWDYRDQLQMTQRQKVNDDDTEGATAAGERTWCVYDAAGQRLRKVTKASDGTVKCERRYLGGYEIFVGAVTRETLHVMDDQQRVAMIETRTAGAEPKTPAQVIRYQVGDQLGSSRIELDAAAALLSYEEYSPFGSTVYQAKSDAVSAKRYRFTGQERDEESGLSQHGARYYATWLGRWTACDPKGLVDGENLYSYCRNGPTSKSDRSGFTGEQLTFTEVHQQAITATRTGRGISASLRADFQKVWDAFGPGGKSQVLHPDDAPHALQPAGTVSNARVGDGSDNMRDGAQNVRPRVAAARAAGQFVRETEVDTKAQLGLKFPRQPRAFWRDLFKGWFKAVRPEPQTLPPSTPPPPHPSKPMEQLELPLAGPAPAPAPPAGPSVGGLPEVAPVSPVLKATTGVLGGLASVVNVYGTMKMIRDAKVADQGYYRSGPTILSDENGKYELDGRAGFIWDTYKKIYITGPLAGQERPVRWIDQGIEQQKARDEYGYFDMEGNIIPGRVLPTNVY